jgi:hypothetical protein
MNQIPSISSLHQEKSDQVNTKNDMYNIVLNKCIDKIKMTNKQTEQTYIIFDVPTILIGYPSYNLKSCILFLMNQLNKHGYIIEFLEPCFLYIDWGTHKNLMSSSSSSSNDKLKSQTKTLLEKFPNASKIEYFLEDASIPEFKYKSNKQLLKKKRKK